VSRDSVRLNIILFLIFFINGCSYSPKVVRVPIENLADSNPKKVVPSLPKDSITNEDDLIIQAIFYEMRGEYKKSNHFYSLLFDKTGNVAYMFRELTTALYAGIDSKNVPKLAQWVKTHPDDVKSKRLLISFYINEKKIEEAKRLGREIVLQGRDAIDYELSASPYILSGDYEKAVDLLTKAYDKTYNEDILLKIVILLSDYMGDLTDASNRLENYKKLYGCNEKLCIKLLEIYTKEQKVDALLSVYKDLYNKTKKDIYAIKLVEGYIYKKEFNKAIKFLKKDYNNDELLYEVYLAKKDYQHAFNIAEKLYSIDKSPRWLAESAMALYEKSRNKNDKKMLNRVVRKFEKALKEGVKDSVYLNYYGYTLINSDIDIPKGIAIVKDALKEEPNNSYYLDSLAWGYYKLHECKKAYNEMRKVIDTEEFQDADIVQHWIAIQECNSNNSKLSVK
jgi:tetratricopeptide (TPR) repeat protein